MLGEEEAYRNDWCPATLHRGPIYTSFHCKQRHCTSGSKHTCIHREANRSIPFDRSELSRVGFLSIDSLFVDEFDIHDGTRPLSDPATTRLYVACLSNPVDTVSAVPQNKKNIRIIHLTLEPSNPEPKDVAWLVRKLHAACMCRRVSLIGTQRAGYKACA